jgi:hypothetical protein
MTTARVATGRGMVTEVSRIDLVGNRGRSEWALVQVTIENDEWPSGEPTTYTTTLKSSPRVGDTVAWQFAIEDEA